MRSTWKAWGLIWSGWTGPIAKRPLPATVGWLNIHQTTGTTATGRHFCSTSAASDKSVGRSHYVKSSQFLFDQQTSQESHQSEGRSKSAMELVGPELHDMFTEIHSELDKEIHHNQAELSDLAKYYFDGKGKAIRPVIAMTLAHAFNHSQGVGSDESLLWKQRRGAIISEMIHTASLLHDDVLDKADTRRGKAAVNKIFTAKKATFAGDYIIAIASKLISQIRNEDVTVAVSQILADLVRGEFQQLQVKKAEAERFELYLHKTFNKTASLIAFTCKANAILTRDHSRSDNDNLVTCAYEYGRNIGIAFQLVDDLLDFVGSSQQLGKPGQGADLKLGLATAPVLFASVKYPELEPLIRRRFGRPGDVEEAFKTVMASDGLDRTKELAEKHCGDALNSLKHIAPSLYKDALISLAQVVIGRIK